MMRHEEMKGGGREQHVSDLVQFCSQPRILSILINIEKPSELAGERERRSDYVIQLDHHQFTQVM